MDKKEIVKKLASEINGIVLDEKYSGVYSILVDKALANEPIKLNDGGEQGTLIGVVFADNEPKLVVETTSHKVVSLEDCVFLNDLED